MRWVPTIRTAAYTGDVVGGPPFRTFCAALRVAWSVSRQLPSTPHTLGIRGTR